MNARSSLRLQNISELAESSGMSHAGVSKALGRSAIQPVSVDTRVKVYDAPQALRFLLAGDGLDGRHERSRLDCERADGQALANQVRRGELIDLLDVETAGASIMSSVAMRVLSLRTIAPEVRAAPSDAEGAEVIEEAARQALEELSRLGQIVGELRRKGRPRGSSVDGSDEAAAEADGEPVGGQGAEAIA